MNERMNGAQKMPFTYIAQQLFHRNVVGRGIPAGP